MDRLLPLPESPAAWRTLRYFAATRVLIAAALLLMQGSLGLRSDLASVSERLFLLSAAYLALAAVFTLVAVAWPQRFQVQALGQLVLDIALISALLVVSGGLAGGYAILYLLPLAGASLLISRVLVFFFCSVAVLVILFDASLRMLHSGGGEALLFQAGVFGAVLFGVTALLQWLSSRLAGQERLVQSRDRDLRNQLAINRLVIAQIDQGVVVVDHQARVKANNLAARRMFGLAPEAQLTGRNLAELPQLEELAAAFSRWRDSAPLGSASLVLEPFEGSSAGRLRARFVQPAVVDGEEFLIFLQDLRELEDRAQQLKLAAMGRLTASIAHEIRNPLAAISQAGQLIAEDSTDPLQRRLADIVRDNTKRLNNLVEDVLRVARREPPSADKFELGGFVADWLARFESERPTAVGRTRLSSQGRIEVKFEPSHLRQVIYNLVDNALRYASEAAGAVEISVERSSEGRAELWVCDDGPGIGSAARAALFEPFYTTRSEGTGLGLFLAREFCASNGAELSYAARASEGGSARSGFVVRFSADASTEPKPDSMQAL